MTRLVVITGDSPNALLARMHADLAVAPLPPFVDERIVVQSLGMERWVRQQLALRQGCAASLDLPFPAAFCRTLSEALFRTGSGTAMGIDARFEEQALIWRVFALLTDDALLAQPVFEPLRAFVAGGDEAKRYGLAQRVAGRFDEYRLYRPQWLLDWEEGRDNLTDNVHEAWQAALWRRLLEGERPMHFARWFLHTIDRLNAADTRPEGLPERVSVFGVSTLPPLFVQLLQAVARFVPVRVYMLAPDAHSWREGAARHPLFESFGAASRALLATLTAPDAHGAQAAVEHVGTPATADPAPPRLLRRVQQDLRAAHRGPPHMLASDDRSLSVHVCYSPMREMEMLRDQLLDALAADPTLRPHDVLVMVPDVELYAPLAEAIFGDPRAQRVREETLGGADASRPAIPYRVADRTLVREAAPARALLACLSLVSARCTASEVIGLLTAPVVRRAANIAPAQLDQIVGWVEDAAIRWGQDGAMRAAAFGLPAVDDNSWRRGLERLLTGYATGRTDTLVSGVLPVAGDLVGDTALLGAFVEWVERLFDTLDALRTARPLTAWSRILQETARQFIKPEGADEQAAFDRLQRDLARLGDLAAPQGDARRGPVGPLAPDAPVTFEVVRGWLDTTLATDEHANQFLAGGVTICAMKPMRAIPHRVIAMLGLDDKAYPRRTRRAAFDLIGSSPTLGDRDARTDDRQLILDTVMSAGDRLLLSYVGRSQKNNAEIAPSIVIDELLDFVDTQVTMEPPGEAALGQGAGAGNGYSHVGTPPTRARARVRVAHRLQPFSPDYFREDHGRDARLFSFDAELAHSVAIAANPARAEAPPFLTSVPPVPVLYRDTASVPRPLEPQIVTLNDLLDAWVNPARLYCRRVLQLHTRGDDPMLEDVEPMAIDALLSSRVQQEMLEAVLAGRVQPSVDRARAVAAGQLPSGALGPHWYDALRRDLAPLLARVGTPVFGEPFVVDITGPDWQLTGQLDLQVEDEQWRVRASSLKAKDTARAWIAHVVRNAGGTPATTRVFAKDGTRCLPPLAEARAQLDVLVQGYRAVLAAPVPYFVEAGHAYRKAVLDPKQQTDPMQAAKKAYESDGSHHSLRGDRTDPYVALLWRGRQPITECWADFTATADAFWARCDVIAVTGDA